MQRAEMAQEAPLLGMQLGEVERQLERAGQLGVLSISVLQRETIDGEGWDDYESTLEEISAVVNRLLRRTMRSSDLLLEPFVAGNTFVVFLGPPRKDRALDRIDLGRVRHRLHRGLLDHLRRYLSASATQHFGVYVGAALMRYDSTVELRRIVYRGVESAFADAVGQRKLEGRRHSISVATSSSRTSRHPRR